MRTHADHADRHTRGPDLARFRALIAGRTGLTVPDRDLSRLVGILDTQMRVAGIRQRGDYLDRLLGEAGTSGPLWTALVARLTVPETFFNRDRGQLEAIERVLLPELIERNRSERRLRIWSAGCSTGEEPYSIAMIVRRLLPRHEPWDVLIVGTDINAASLDRARRAVYTDWSFRRMTPQDRDACFRQTSAGWHLDERIRAMVTFEQGNLVLDEFPRADGPLHDMDLILCRNVFIYFDRQGTAEVVRKLTSTLRPGGFLMTGHTELVGLTLPGLRPRRLESALALERSDAPEEPVARVPLVERRRAIRRPEPPAGSFDARGRRDRPVVVPLARPAVAPALADPASTFDTVMARGYAAADAGDHQAARQAARAAAELSEFAPEPFLLEATVAELEGDRPRARRLLDKALYLDPTCVPAYLTLAELHEQEGNIVRAEALRERAQALTQAEGP